MEDIEQGAPAPEEVMPEEAVQDEIEATLPVKILRGYWPLDGRGYCDVGAEVDLPDSEARDVISKSIAVRNDPL